MITRRNVFKAITGVVAGLFFANPVVSGPEPEKLIWDVTSGGRLSNKTFEVAQSMTIHSFELNNYSKKDFFVGVYVDGVENHINHYYLGKGSSFKFDLERPIKGKWSAKILSSTWEPGDSAWVHFNGTEETEWESPYNPFSVSDT